LNTGFRHYDRIVKNDKFASFLATMAEIKSSHVTSSIKKNKKKQTVVLSITKAETSNLKKLCKKSKKIKKHIKTLKKTFKKQTGQKLQYVMISNASAKVVKAFEKQKVTVIAKASKVTLKKDTDLSTAAGIVQLDAKRASSKNIKKMLKNAFAKSSVKATPLRECVKAGSLNSFVASDAETTDAEVDKTAAMKSTLNTDADTDAEEATTVASNAATTEQTTPVNAAADSSASSAAVSSVLSIAAIAAAALFLL
jgi:hypothetical protein